MGQEHGWWKGEEVADTRFPPPPRAADSAAGRPSAGREGGGPSAGREGGAPSAGREGGGAPPPAAAAARGSKSVEGRPRRRDAPGRLPAQGLGGLAVGWPRR